MTPAAIVAAIRGTLRGLQSPEPMVRKVTMGAVAATAPELLAAAADTIERLEAHNKRMARTLDRMAALFSILDARDWKGPVDTDEAARQCRAALVPPLSEPEPERPE